MARACASLVAALVFTGCHAAGWSEVIKEKSVGKGVAQVYATSEEQAFAIARQVFRWDGADPGAIDERREDHLMLSTLTRTALYRTYNELSSRPFTNVAYQPYLAKSYIGFWAEPAESNGTKVTYLVSEELSEAEREEAERALQRRFQQALAIVQSGQPLPGDPPPAD